MDLSPSEQVKSDDGVVVDTDDGVEVGGVKCSDNVSIFTLFHLNLEIVIKTI